MLGLFKEALENEKIQTYIFTDSNRALEKIKSHPDLCSVIPTDYTSQIKRSRRKFARDVKALNERIKVILTSGYTLSEHFKRKL